jgi:uncharacterized protein DUF5709
MTQSGDEGEIYGEYSVDDENQLQPEDTLVDRGLDDALDEGYSPPDREPANLRFGTTWEEEHTGETLEQRLLQEEPDPDPYADDGSEPGTEQWPDDALADRRAGRLVAPDQGIYEDHDQAPLAEDVGIDGAGASAEEAAMHIEGEF